MTREEEITTVIEDFIEGMFRNHEGEEAFTLVLTAKDGRNLGGWSKVALKGHLRKAFGLEFK